MAIKSDIEIAQATKLLPIVRIAEKLGIPEDDLELYGKYKAKVNLNLLDRLSAQKDGNLSLSRP
jgi:formate--tetrahydrofolate ligase